MGVFVLVFGSSLKTLQCGYDGYAQLPCPASSAQPPRCREMLHVLWWYLLLVRLQLAVSESCDSSDGGSESSFVALPPRTRRCLAANFKFPDLKRLAESGHFREVWGSSEEMEQWFREHFACRRSGLLQESMQFDVANFANVAKAMTKLGWPRMTVDWKAIEWGKDIPIPMTKKEHNFGYGKLLVNGLYTMLAFAQSDSTDWRAYVQGLGSLLGEVALELVPGVGPILSAALTFALAFFQPEDESNGNHSADDAMADLYNKIMAEVKLLIRAQEVKDAMSAAKGQLAGFMQMLSAMPTDFVVDPSSPLSKEQQWYNVLQRYISVMDASEFNIFGNEANCTMPMSVPMQPWSVKDASDDCLEFWASGAFIFQFQYVMIHLNTMAQMAAFGSKDQTMTVLSALQGKAKTYFSLLNASLLGLVKGLPPDPECKWIVPQPSLHIQGMFVSRANGGHMQDALWNGHSLRCVLGCIDAVQDDFDLKWAPGTNVNQVGNLGDYRSLPCSRPPIFITGSDVKPGTLDEKATFRLCSSFGFHYLSDLVTNETMLTFEPMVQALLNLSLGEDDSKEIMDWLTASPPGPNGSEAVNSTVIGEFCGPVCTYLSYNACNSEDNCQRASSVQDLIKCTEVCSEALEAFANSSKTRCNCKSIVCPAFKRGILNKLNNLPYESWYHDSDTLNPDSSKEVGPVVFAAWQASLLKTGGHQGQCEIECNRLFPITTLDVPNPWY